MNRKIELRSAGTGAVALFWALSLLGCGGGAQTCSGDQLICYENPADTSGAAVCCPAGYVIYNPTANVCVSSSYGYSGTYWNCFSQ